MAYVECLLAEYGQMTIPYIVHRLNVTLGFALLDARAARLGTATIGYIERAIIDARAKCRRWYEENYEIID